MLNDRYEVIVVGAGVGGLSAAAVLAFEGIEVLLVEQAHRPGGACSSFRVHDFTFDAGASVIQGFGEHGFHVLRTLFDFLNQQVELMPRDSAYSMCFGEHRIDFVKDLGAFTSELGAMFPQYAGSLISLMQELDRLYHSVLDCSGPLRPGGDEPVLHRLGLIAHHPLSYMSARRNERRGIERVLREYADDPLVMSFFDADLNFCTGYRLADLTATHAALSIMDRLTGGTHYPIGSSQQIPDRLEKSIVENGGRTVYRTPVTEIAVENGRAVGVKLENGRFIGAEAVVSNTSVLQLFGKLLAPDHRRPETREWLASFRPAWGPVALFLGVEQSAIPEGFPPTTLLVDDPERVPERYIAVSIPSLLDPNLAPEGFHSLTVIKPSDPGSWPESADDDYDQTVYVERKEEESAVLLERLEELLPGLSGKIVEKRAATPTTYARHTMRPGGALSSGTPAGKLAPASLPGAVTSVRGLFLTGDSTYYGRGVSSAAASGINSAVAAMRYLGLKSPVFAAAAESRVFETVPLRPQISGTGVVDEISAVLESHRCLDCPDAPCSTACPARIDIPTFIRRVEAGDFAGAAQTIRCNNPLGGICGVVCPAERLCEHRCRRAEIDEPISIARLEALSCGMHAGPDGWLRPFRWTRRGRVAVIGAGPAGISCAYYLSQLGYAVEVFETSLGSGGLPASAMPRSTLDFQAVEREVAGAFASGVEFRGNTTFGRDITFDSLAADGYRAVFLGTGLRATLYPEIEGTDIPGVVDALTFLSSARRGVKRELTDRVAVLGHNGIALCAALLAGELGAGRVFLIASCPLASIEASGSSVEAARAAKVKLLTETRVARIIGEGRVTRVEITPAAGAKDGSAKGQEPVIDVGTVIISGLRKPDADLERYLGSHLQLGPGGTVVVDPRTMMTSKGGVFAGGDLVSGGGLVVEACADGRRAALAMDRYLTSAVGPAQDAPGSP